MTLTSTPSTPTVLRLPGVYRPQRDTWLLAEAVARELAPSDARPSGARPLRVLEIGSGTGFVSATAAAFPGVEVTAVDVSRRALASTWLTARMRGTRVAVRRGDLAAPVRGQSFDLVVANPPYVPAATERLPSGGPARAWDGGIDGRAVLDRVCAQASELVPSGGRVLLVHSAICGESSTAARLAEQGLEPEVVARYRQPFGPVMRARAALLERRGLVEAGTSAEELVVVRGRRP